MPWILSVAVAKPAATALILPLAWDPPCAVGVALKRHIYIYMVFFGLFLILIEPNFIIILLL